MPRKAAPRSLLLETQTRCCMLPTVYPGGTGGEEESFFFFNLCGLPGRALCLPGYAKEAAMEGP
ncbi:MAG: hypothetical protein AMJ46_07025 [Latescibacteria bacterium DG_63]|nr:MAG: hypothetical protein AMJ46_07025 [Latescibacteria bacterium DG_63]